MFKDALTYPLRKSGWIMLFIGSIMFSVQNLLGSSIIGLCIGAYFFTFYLSIISSTVTGHDDIPDWPSFSNFWDDILVPAGQQIILLLISAAPLCIVAFSSEALADWTLVAVVAALIYAGLYYPMATLALIAFGSVAAALPHRVIPGMIRAMPGYLLGALGLLVAMVVFSLGGAYAEEIPYLGWFVTACLGLYSLMVQARLLGLLYLRKRDAIGWE